MTILYGTPRLRTGTQGRTNLEGLQTLLGLQLTALDAEKFVGLAGLQSLG